jgi:hypothetical protein
LARPNGDEVPADCVVLASHVVSPLLRSVTSPSTTAPRRANPATVFRCAATIDTPTAGSPTAQAS